jgi:GNAT superfamily N-acetyltransferase
MYSGLGDTALIAIAEDDDLRPFLYSFPGCFRLQIRLETQSGVEPPHFTGLGIRSSTMQIVISVPPAVQLESALQLAIGPAPPDELDAQVESMLAGVERGEMSLEGLRVARVDAQIVGAVLAVCQPDGTAHVWPPRVTTTAPNGTSLALATACREWIDNSHATIAQCLTRIDDHAAQELLEQVGFERLTDLNCWQHDFGEAPHAPLPEHCEVLEFSSANAERFRQVMQQTYAGSQDCAGLHGRRTAEDSLAAHQLAADEESRLWQIYQCADEDVGVVLCADHRDQRMWELLYLGVVPKFRRQGFGLAFLCEALWHAREAGAEGMFLAADDANKAAADLYAACGFSIAFRQRIHVWFPARGAKM